MVFKSIRDDIDSFMARDPAARSRLEIALCYPGFHAIVLYRIANAVWRRRFYLLARWISQVARLITGIEIHPGAVIGRRLFIDHGFGVVIGETSEIGDDVTLYQGVTLGGIAPSVDSASQVNRKRHPTLQNGVIVGSGAQVLGPITIGEKARVGANAVVTRDLPAEVTAVGIPAHGIMPKDRSTSGQFVPYGTPAEGCPDPVLATIENLRGQVAALQVHVRDLESRLDDAEAASPREDGGSGRQRSHPAPMAVEARGR
jgi:serine O-acetyltransferase